MQVTLDKTEPKELISANGRAQVPLRLQNASTRKCHVWLGTEGSAPTVTKEVFDTAPKFSRGEDFLLAPGESLEVRDEDFAWAYSGEETLFCVTGVVV